MRGPERRERSWLDGILQVPYLRPPSADRPVLRLIRQDWEALEINRSTIKTPLRIGRRRYQHGLGTHSVSHIRVYSPDPIDRFKAEVGADNNVRTGEGQGSVTFCVAARGRVLYASEVLCGGEDPQAVDVDVGGARTIDLHVGDGGDGPDFDHADWADAVIVTRGGKTVRVDGIELGTFPVVAARYPFSFVCGGGSSDELLGAWRHEERTEELDADRTRTTHVWTDPDTGLRVRWEAVRFADFPALEWMLYFENTGKADTPIIEDVQSLDLTFDQPLSVDVPYRLHKAHGGTPDPAQFEPSTVVISQRRSDTLDAGTGRSSTQNFPFFKIETGRGPLIIAVGWSGKWHAALDSPDDKHLRVTAGLAKTHFLLHPGEKVRGPRSLVFHWEGDTLESNARFRQLIFRHYAAKPNGETPLPPLFCNTAFTRGGGWLNECNADNQISLIRAYGPLGLEALITDAGWFEGGWPEGAGNWTPRKDAYPDGMAPVAAAAAAEGMIYGLWFEPERVVAGTWIHGNHPEWLLRSTDEPQDTYLLNMALPEVRDHLFGVVRGFMDLPGFRFYRQDFNMDPLPYWIHTDAPDRQGITEMKYIEGLYAYWDRIATAWPDSIREECASGGHRIDLETVMRMHIHQKTDYWFDNEVDQASTWSLSQYLPNGTFVTPINRLDDYSFHSALASSLCVGWIADARGFDAQRARRLLDRYREVRHLLVGAWYPLLPYSRALNDWIAWQHHRPDLEEGMILVFRRPESPYRTAEVSLRGLDADATYELSSDGTGTRIRATGADLTGRFELIVPDQHRSDLIIYRKTTD